MPIDQPGRPLYAICMGFAFHRPGTGIASKTGVIELRQGDGIA